jgi:hypothetical protein
MRCLDLLLVLAVAAGCAGPQGLFSAPDPRRAQGEVPLADLIERPQDYDDWIVSTRGFVVATGSVEGGTWIELAPSKEKLVQVLAGVQTEKTLDSLSRKTIVLLFPVTVAPGSLDDLHAKEVELRLHVGGTAVLADGRRVLGVTPVTITTAVEPVAAQQEIAPEEVAAAAARVLEEARRGPEPPAAAPAGEADLVERLWAAPEEFAGRVVDLRFRVAATGQSNGGQWYEPESPRGGAERPRLFVPGFDRPERPGDTVEWRAEVGGLMSLDVGGRAVIVHPEVRPPDR